MSDDARQRVVAIATEILNGGIELFVGVRFLAGALRAAGLDHDEDGLYIRGVDSETDTLVLPGSRHLWHESVLAEKDAEREEYARRIREDVFASCRALIRKATADGTQSS